MADVIEACLESFTNVKYLKPEQKLAVKCLLDGKDVLAILSTGFGKSLIYQLYILAKIKSGCHRSCTLIISPLKSIIEDQMKSFEELSISATELTIEESSLGEIFKYQVIFTSAENCLSSAFKQLLKREGKQISLIVIDESHTVDTWGTAKMKGKRVVEPAFRKDYGNLASLRSFCEQGTPLLASTGTGSAKLTKKIKTMLAMRADTKTITVSPGRPNIRYTVKLVEKGKEMEQLNWIMDIAKEFGTLMPKTIVFCNTYPEIAAVLSYILKVLSEAAYTPHHEKCPSNRIVAIYHSTTWKKYKDRVTSSFNRGNGNARILLASSALGMGVNFPDIRYVVHFGPARSVIDHVQQSGRAGRDGKLAHNVVIATGQKLAQCKTAVKEFVRASTCLRKALLQSIGKSVVSVEPLHSCCSNCSKLCKCSGENCSGEKFSFENSTSYCLQTQQKTRVVCNEDRVVLKEALKEYQNSLSESSTSLFGSTAAHGFSDELISSVVHDAESIFTLEDLFHTSPVFSKNHAKFILDIFQDIFQDIPCATCNDISDTDLVYSVDEMELVHAELTEADYFKTYFDNTDSDDEDPDLLAQYES